MCGRFVSPSHEELLQHFGFRAASWAGLARNENAAPTQAVPVVTGPSAGALARWGLIPPWWKDPKPPRSTFNARIEAASKPTWRQRLKSARCLVPACAWFEWKKSPEQKSDRSSGQRFLLRVPGSEVFAFAGLFARWTGPDGVETLSCAIMTRPPTAGIAHIHDRMPAILPAAAYQAWLAGSQAEAVGAASRDWGLEIEVVRMNLDILPTPFEGEES